MGWFKCGKKSGTNTEKFRPNTEFRKYGRKNAISTSVHIPSTSDPDSDPVPDFSENTETDGSNVENGTGRNGENSIRFQPYTPP